MRNLLFRTILAIVLLVGITSVFATNVFTEDFEGTPSFTIVNGTQTNQWYVGAPGLYAGTKGAYISNDAGVTNAYTLTATSTTHMYRSVTFPTLSGAEQLVLTFKWRCSGEGSYDNIKVFLDTGTPVAGTVYSSTYQLPNSTTYYSGQATWQTATIAIPAANSGLTKNLIIQWKNDSSGGTTPPASVDDISVDTVDPTIVSFPNVQNMEASVPPAFWVTALGSGTNSNRFASSTTWNHTSGGTKSAYVSGYSSAASEVYMATPPINFPSDSYRVRFWFYRYAGTTQTNNLKVYYNTAQNLTGATLLGTYCTAAGNAPAETAGAGWYQYTINMPVGAGGNGRYLLFGANAQSSAYNSFYIDDISIEAIPSVPNPAILVSPANAGTNILKTATLNWTADGSGSTPTGYKLYFGTDNPPTNMVNGTDLGLVTTYAPTVNYGVTYYWTIVPYTGATEATGCPVWSYTVMADPTITVGPSTPYNQGFDTASPFPPLGWLNYRSAGTGTYIWAYSTAGSYPTQTPHTAPGQAFIQTYNNAAGTINALVTPPVVVPTDNYRLTFWMYRDASSSTSYPNEGIKVYYGSTPTDTVGTQLGYIHRRTVGTPVVAAAGWYQYKYAFGAGSAGTKYIIFNAFSDYGYNMFIDDMVIEIVPPVPDPAVATYPINAYVGVGPLPTFTWTAGAGAAPTGYRISIGTTTAANELVNNYDNGALTSYTYAGTPLTQATVYYWKIVPYNANGDAADCPTWSFTTATAVTGVATTPSPADAATYVMNNAQLSWATVANATSYDVYFGTTLPGTANANVTVLTWNPGTLTYGATYSWKIVPKNGFGDTSGTPTVWSFTVGPDPVVTTFPLNESFDGTTYAPYGWTNQRIVGTATPGLWARSTSGSNPACTPHSGAGMSYYNAYSIAANNHTVLSTPPMTIPGDDYRVTFWMYRDLSSSYNTLKYSDEGVSVWYGTSPTDTTLCTQLTFVPRDGVFAPTVAANGWYQYVVPFGAGTAGSGKYVMFKAKSQFGNNMFLDDVSVQQIPTAPLPAINVSPANNATNVALDATLNWTYDPAGPTPDGYKLYFGTDASPAYVGDLGNVTTYTPTLVQDGHYYWKIVPYTTAFGDATGSVVWNFYTVGRPQPATTPNPADLATDVARNATLTWAAVSTATSYDVYFGTTLPGTPTTNVTTTSYTPALMAATTGYQWMIVPKNTYGDALSCPTWSFTTGTSIVYGASYAIYTADDDIGQFIMADVTNPAVHPDSLANAASNNTYTDYTAVVIHVEQDHTYPAVVHQINEDTYYTCWAKVFIDFNQNGNFETTEQVLSGQTSSTHMEVGGNIYIPGDAATGDTRLRIVLRESGSEATTLAVGTYSWGETEDYTINIAPYTSVLPPNPANVGYPADLATGIGLLPNFTWSSGGGTPTGYMISLGTDNPPTSIQFEKDLGLVTTWAPEVGDLAYSTRYYWQIIPYNAYGNAVGCPVWQFDTGADPAINSFPYTMNFDSVVAPALPNLWTTETFSAPTINWVTSTTNPNSAPNCMRIGYDSSNPLDDWFYSAPVTMAAGGLYTVTFVYRSSSSYIEKLGVSVGTAQNVAGMTTLLWSKEDIMTATYTSQTVSYVAPAAGTYYFGWHAYSDADMYYICVDDIVFNHPTDPVLSVDKTSLVLPVTPIGGGSSDALTISNIGVGTLTGTISYSAGLSGETSFSIDNVTPFVFDVVYEPTVQGLFTGTVTITSAYGNATVNVESNAGIDVADFEASFPPWFTWDNDTNTDYGWGWYTGLPHTGLAAVGVDTHDQGVTADEWLITSWYDIAAGDKVSFYWRTTGTATAYPEQLKVLMSTTGNTPPDFTTVLLDTGSVIQFAYTGVEIDLTPYIGQTAAFAFNCVSGSTGWYLMVDDIGMPGLAGVIVPTGLVAMPDPSGVLLTWDAVPTATSYRIYTSADPYAAPELWTLLTEEYTNSYLDAVPAGMNFYKVTAVNGTKAMNNAHALQSQRPVVAKELKSATGTSTKK